MEDYYSLLGLDPEASQESIKIAYRRLAREHHPDRNVHSTESDKKIFSEHMAQLNEAYSVLSDSKLKREYDEKIKLLHSLQASKTAPRAKETVAKQPKPSPRSAPRNDDVDSTLATELSKQLRSNLVKHHKAFAWEEIILEGFDWGLEGSSGLSHYCVAGRGFGVLDPASAKKFTNYAEVIIARYHRSIRRSHFLFLLPFQRLNDWESVSSEFNRFFSAENHTKFSSLPVAIVLLDARQGRSMKFGTKLSEKQLEPLLRAVSTPS